jgi:hypothetical protein
VNQIPNVPWYSCLSECETEVPCGTGRHIVRWEAGSLRLAAHPDVEGELVLAALGGQKARCVELAQAWARHAGDLSVLAVGPRGPADAIAVSWEDVAEAAAERHPPAPGLPRTGPMRLASQPGPSLARAAARRQQMQEEMNQATQRRNDMLSLLALGYGFQVRLAGQVAAAHAGPDDRGGGEGTGPALVAAIAGRLAPVAEEWLGIDPGQVVVNLHHGPGWGSAELTGRGEDRRLRVALPAGWLARVWACGLARVGRYLIVATEQPGWPAARVLGIRSPGAEPELLDVRAGASGPPDVPDWEL